MKRRRIKYRYRRGYRAFRRDVKKFMLYMLIIFITTTLPVLVVTLPKVLGGKEQVAEKQEINNNCRDITIPYDFLNIAYEKSKEDDIQFAKILAYSAYEANIDDGKYSNKILKRAIRQIKDGNMNKGQKELYEIYCKIFNDLEVSPIPRERQLEVFNELEKKWDVMVTDSYEYTNQNDFGDARTYGGNRKHEGNDLITDMGTPIVSITDGIVTRIGWNELGGKRIGITSNSGAYFYYAHMDRFSKNITKDKVVKAGDIIGYVGDTGMGPEGTRGKMIPHLHVQIGYSTPEKRNYTWYNPYDVIKFLENRRVTLIERRK